MTVDTIHIDQLLTWLLLTFEGDDELVQYFDPGCPVTGWESCCTAIDQKIRVNYPTATIRCVLDEDYPIGYYVVENDLLISFGLRRAYRKKEWLLIFWDFIKSEFDGPFSCVLYSKNTRAIGWLEKAGMKLLFENVSILNLCPQED